MAHRLGEPRASFDKGERSKKKVPADIFFGNLFFVGAILFLFLCSSLWISWIGVVQGFGIPAFGYLFITTSSSLKLSPLYK